MTCKSFALKSHWREFLQKYKIVSEKMVKEIN